MATLKPCATVRGEGGEEKGMEGGKTNMDGRREAANAHQIKSDLVVGSWRTPLREMMRYGVLRVLNGWNLAN